MRTWDAEQIRWFLDSVAGDRLEALWRLAVTTGMLRGDVLGLRWGDTDLDAGTLSVRHQVTAYAGKMYAGDAKSDGSRRLVDLDPRTVETLRQHRRRQLEERIAYGEGWEQNDLVFTREDGTPIRPSWMTRELPRLAEQSDPRDSPPTVSGIPGRLWRSSRASTPRWRRNGSVTAPSASPWTPTRMS